MVSIFKPRNYCVYDVTNNKLLGLYETLAEAVAARTSQKTQVIGEYHTDNHYSRVV
jgi:hypothetical protein